MSAWSGKRIFITGGTGTWGREFTQQLLDQGAAHVGIYSRGEYRQVEMRRAFQQYTEITYILGDVRDLDYLVATTRGYDVIIHLAALKHVPIVEDNPREAVKTNILGTQNVIDAAGANHVARVLYVSSDKAVDPLNFYGITKLAAERMVVAANQECPQTQFITYRAGNVMGSAGSVVPVFQETLLSQNLIRLTDPTMTRFFLSKREVVRLACHAMEIGLGGEVFIPRMKATTLDLLSRIMIQHLGRGDVRKERIGVRPGEKLHELLIGRNEAPRTRSLPDLWVLLPFFVSRKLEAHYAAAPPVEFEEYGSDTAPAFSHEELEALLKAEGFLTPAPHMTGPLYFKKDAFDFH
ncbi:MAG TPA: SDR family NAD(P)-dependent oxidoreductase [Pirellulaceae bacterium]